MSFRINTNVQAMNALRNLSATSNEASTVMTRLSSGLRINSGADDPAGLQISEGFRSQLAGIDQALRNNQDASNYAKTAEGALGEVNKLLRDARALAVANGNDATLTTSQKQANQTQLSSILSSIDRIASQTQFGSKKLLDGSSGVQATITDATKLERLNIGGIIGTQSVTANGGVSIDVTTDAARAATTAVQSRDLGVNAGAAAATVGAANAGSFTINGVNFTSTASMTNAQVRDMVNAKSADTGVTVSIVSGALAAGANSAFVFTANKFGTLGNNIQISSASTTVAAAASTINLSSGANAVVNVTVGSLNPVQFDSGSTDDGLTVRDVAGNSLRLTELGNATNGAQAIGQVLAGSAQFQIGGNAGQTTNLSLGNFSSSSLGMSGLDVMSSAGAADALAKIDAASESVSKSRGDLGNFTRNVIDSNTRSLGVARENLSAADSTIRDTDVAAEMTRFTQLQILQQSGMAMLAQANSQSQSVLSLLRG